MHVHPRFVRQRKRTRGWISSPLPLQRMSGIHVAYYINETLCSGMCNNVIRIFASLWSFISHRNIECLISKTQLMVFGLENNGPSFYYWTTAMKENAQLLASVVRWRGWFQEWLEMARVCRFSNIGQSVHWCHGYVLAVGMYCHLARNYVFVREQYWVQNGREISSSCLLLMCLCVICVCAIWSSVVVLC